MTKDKKLHALLLTMEINMELNEYAFLIDFEGKPAESIVCGSKERHSSIQSIQLER